MGVPMIEADLRSGALLRLEIPEYQGLRHYFDGFFRSDAPGPAGTWLLQCFATQAANDRSP